MMFGIGDPPELNRDGAVISKRPTWHIAVIFIVMLVGALAFASAAIDAIRFSQHGVLVNGKVVSNRSEGTGDDAVHYALVAFTPESNGGATSAEVRAELPDNEAYVEGSAISILYDPDDVKNIRRYYFAEDWFALAFLVGLFGVPCTLLGFNLLRRSRRDIVYTPAPPDDADYTPTAKEDAEYDRNLAAGELPIYGEVNGKWGTLQGKDLEEAKRDFRKGDRMFLAIGLLFVALSVASLILGMWIVSIILFPLGAIFCLVSYFGSRIG
jgi:hypothetical protein